MFRKILFSILVLTGCEGQVQISSTPIEQPKQRFICTDLSTNSWYIGAIVIDTETNQEFLFSRNGPIIKIK